MQLHWDIFCRVIDNYGDIGICWRLARQLAVEHGRRVRLWVDDPSSLQPLCPAVDPAIDGYSCHGVEIRHWRENSLFDRPAEVVIEAFACDLPNAYLASMASADPKPCWINLEYLTAESWADGCHGMASPHPSLPLVKYFFFPGFSGAGGGLLREKNLLDERDRSLLQNGGSSEFEISLFCYDTAPIGGLIDALAKMSKPVTCHVPPGKPLAAVSTYLGGAGPWQCGNALIRPIPFMPMDDYDRLLWRCDVNFVRGEDSFVRAQWAGKPFVWQIYFQDEDAHLIKLEAFLERYCAGMNKTLEAVVREMFLAWNTGSNVELAWLNFMANYADIARYSKHWAETQASQPDLASALVKFCAAKV
uniref:Protein-arginine rhamnosyltransferase n=1 Tax=Dechloromonas aromatica (strain RCB) TaxID=159087 RepID=Q47EF0_DECAR